MPLFLKSSNSVRIFFSERPSRSSYIRQVCRLPGESSGRHPVPGGFVDVRSFSQRRFSRIRQLQRFQLHIQMLFLGGNTGISYFHPVFVFKCVMKVLILHFFKYEDINSSYSSRLYWLNPFCFIAKRSLSSSPIVTTCLPITVNCSHSPFSLSRYSRCAKQ